MRRLKLLTALGVVVCVGMSAQVNVNVNLNVKHKVGNVETFDRHKFVNFHGTIEEGDWIANNKLPNLIGDLLEKRDVHVGRNTGSIQWIMNGVVTEDPARPGFADPKSIEKSGERTKLGYAKNKTWCHKYEAFDKQILCTQVHPFYPNGKKTNKGWAFSQADTEAEPFGTASGEFYGRFIATHFGEGGVTGQPKPAFVEVVNEPLWDLATVPKDESAANLNRIYKFHSTVAKEVRKYNPGMQVGGYCTAFPDYDSDNFGRWINRDKRFIDVAGADMDYWTIHLYDFPCFNNGKEKYRKGANMEATMDMLEQYSMIKLGHTKPLMISEYNAQTHDLDWKAETKGWNGYRDWLKIKSSLSMMMQFMERADKINYAMPFFMLKCEWAVSGNTPEEKAKTVHGARMVRKENEPLSYTGDFVYTDVIKMYDLLKDINGVRVDTYTDNQDIMVDAYVNKNKAYVMINNLDFKALDLDLSVLGMPDNPVDIEVRHLYCDNKGNSGNPTLDIKHYATLPDKLTLKKEATYVIVYSYPEEVLIDELSEETKYYADTYLKEISNSKELSFNIDGVKLANYGEAVLRVGVARKHGLSLVPNVKVNGKSISIPSNFRGGPQTDRDNYFGVLEIPVPYEVLEPNNKVEIAFPGTGGHVSTVTMQVFNFSKDIRKNPTSIESDKMQASTFKLFPNPTNDSFVVTAGNGELKGLKIYDMNGSLVMNNKEISTNESVSVSLLNKGMHIVELNTDKGKEVLSLLIK